MARVIVVGAGVVGLTSAVRLLEDGHRVDVVARDLPQETTSSVAAALWYPYRALPQDRVTAWSRETFDVLERLSRHEPEAGVRMRSGTEVLRRAAAEEPWWRSAVPALAPADRLPSGYAAGWTLSVPVVEMPVHLRWLHRRVLDLGGSLTRLPLTALPAGGDVVVNCAGLGSRMLSADLSVVPVRGQVVHVAQVGLDHWWLDPADADTGRPTYVVPREHDIVLGGTDQEGDWDRTPDPATAADVLRRATALVPELAGATVLRHRVGLRPVRPRVRLERDGRVVHCYGHGGAGVTLAWGCAREVTLLVGRTR